MHVFSSRRSNISITHSWFERNSVGGIDYIGAAVIHDSYDNDIVIINTTFINNSGLVHTSDRGSTMKIYDCNFVQNEGTIISGRKCTCDMLITHTRFTSNMYGEYSSTIVSVSDANLAITHSTFTNNTGTGEILDVRRTNMSLSHSEFTIIQLIRYSAAVLVYILYYSHWETLHN